jgi:hypothetical protein
MAGIHVEAPGLPLRPSGSVSAPIDLCPYALPKERPHAQAISDSPAR